MREGAAADGAHGGDEVGGVGVRQRAVHDAHRQVQAVAAVAVEVQIQSANLALLREANLAGHSSTGFFAANVYLAISPSLHSSLSYFMLSGEHAWLTHSSRLAAGTLKIHRQRVPRTDLEKRRLPQPRPYRTQSQHTHRDTGKGRYLTC